MYQMCGVFADFERSMIQERVKAGLARANAKGKTAKASTQKAPKDHCLERSLGITKPQIMYCSHQPVHIG